MSHQEDPVLSSQESTVASSLETTATADHIEEVSPNQIQGNRVKLTLDSADLVVWVILGRKLNR